MIGDMEIQQIIAHFGNISRAARGLGVSRQTIYNWINGRKRLTDMRRRDIEMRMGKQTPASVA